MPGQAAQSFLPARDTPRHFSFSAASVVVPKEARAEANALAIATVLRAFDTLSITFS